MDRFKLGAVATEAGAIRYRSGGRGSPLMLLHGHPRTHATWYTVAVLLSSHFTVICPDLPGFGGSYKPADQSDHANSSKRAKASSLVELMTRLGHETFCVAGHDRGSYAAFRMAMDYPKRVRKLAVLDGVPILEALERSRLEFAQRWWHWFFYAQPEKPERAINADPLGWYGGSPAALGDENFADFHRSISDPATVHGMLEDYRAGLTIDAGHDRFDREGAAGWRARCSCSGPCPTFTATLLLSGERGPTTSEARQFPAATTWRRKRQTNLLSNFSIFLAGAPPQIPDFGSSKKRSTIPSRKRGSSSNA